MQTASGAAVQRIVCAALTVIATIMVVGSLQAQGVTTSAVNGLVVDENGAPVEGALVKAVHEPSGTQYTTLVRPGGAYTIANMRIGGPYTLTIELLGYRTETRSDVYLQLGQPLRMNFSLVPQAVEVRGVEVVAGERIFDSNRTGAATTLDARDVAQLPSVKRSTRDLIRLDPRNDGNFSFAGRNWLYNNISLDGSYFNNPFGLDDPAPGGQTAAEPVPYDAVEQVQVSVAPFDVREGGFTGANINTVTKSGTNEFKASLYTFGRNESLIGNTVRGAEVIADPSLGFNQSGFTLSGPLIRNKLFVFVNGEIERRDDPGTNFVADQGSGQAFGESRATAAVLDQISDRLRTAYNYDTGPYEGFVHETNNNKLLAKVDWNINANNNFTFRYNLLDARRDLPPHPFVLSYNNTGRGPNSSSLPFRNAGYRINNDLNSFALELNSRGARFANRLFASYNRFRDFREPFSEDFPTIEIGEAGVHLTTAGSEPFSVHNILDQDVLQFTNNFSVYRGKHAFTVGANFEYFSFFNSFNIFRHGVFFLAQETGIGSTFDSVQEFMDATDPTNPNQLDFRGMIGTGPFKGEIIDVGQLAFYAQDEFLVTNNLTLTYGVRVDIPMYFTDPVDNQYSRDLDALDENRQPEVVDQSSLPGASPLFSPRVGFNWDVGGRRETQLRGGTGIFTGRVPFVWVGNVISNPGSNPNLWSPFNTGVEQISTSDDAILQQSFDLNAMDPDFKWPQVWTTNLAVDQRLPWDMVGTLEFIYGRDLNAVFMRNADLVPEVRRLDDGRPYYGGFGANELNPDGAAGIYVIDNSSDGYNVNLSAQLRKSFSVGSAMLSYSFTEAKNRLKSTEIASVLWQNQPVQGDPNNPELANSEFGHRHRIVAATTFTKNWSPRLATNFGIVFELAEGNRFAGAGGNRYSFIYAGDVNGDGQGGNDLIYVPVDQNDIRLEAYTSGSQVISAQEQWTRLNAFIQQDEYLNESRGQITERFGGVNPWYSNIDLRVLQDFKFAALAKPQTIQLSLDLLNVANLINSDWGVRKVANPSATSPLRLVRFDTDGEPVLNFVGPAETYIDDPS
ncbi:MAG TPA: carboxypeptidase regulatory-like domain-containing protein, partial [Longimicrobiales bacterium]|nr:carboxypeptidase regulatory-like domain-containing protein [Longimicrobiales bacterium]